MRIEGPVRFRDRQRQRLVLLTATGIPLLLLAMIVLGIGWGTIAFMGIAGALGSAIKIALSSYRVVLTDAALHLQHGFRTHRIPLSVIESVSVAEPRMTDAIFGRGIHRHSLDGSVHSFRVGGLRETVRIEWRQGERTRTTIIGTDRAAELATAILAARGERAGVRVELGDEEREAFEEVEAFLRQGSAAGAR